MYFRKDLLFAAIISAGTVGSAYAHGYKIGEIIIDQAWSRATPPAATTAAGYMTILNKGTTPDRLVEITSVIAGRVEVHQTTMDGTIMRMQPLPEGVAIGAGQSIKLEPGSYHLMMMGLREPLKEGQRVPMTLRFERAGQVTVELAVEGLGATGHAGHGQQN